MRRSALPACRSVRILPDSLFCTGLLQCAAEQGRDLSHAIQLRFGIGFGVAMAVGIGIDVAGVRIACRDRQSA
jgi:hypothetical protein